MSSFNGIIQEIPSIAVDYFDIAGKEFYFLSHCHSDHMQGLGKLTSEAKLYAAPISAFIIKKKYPHLDIRELEIGVLRNFEVTTEDGKLLHVNVTALSAGHCMGACMLLFQIEGKDILYTGDFRISLSNAKRINALNEIVEYDNLVLYLDSTFMKPSYQKFPKLNDSITKTIEISRSHLKACSSNRVHIIGSARYGYERLLIEMSRELKSKFYCFEEEVYQQYSQISEIRSHVTNKTYEAKLFYKPKHLGAAKEERNVLHINLSAMRWEHWDGKAPYFEKLRDDYFRVCYATHNSCDEIEDFISFLKPKKVYLNVIPNVIKDRLEMFKRLREIQSKYMDMSDNEGPKLTKKFSFKRQRTQ